jgi:hypothetical protein
VQFGESACCGACVEVARVDVGHVEFARKFEACIKHPLTFADVVADQHGHVMEAGAAIRVHIAIDRRLIVVLLNELDLLLAGIAERIGNVGLGSRSAIHELRSLVMFRDVERPGVKRASKPLRRGLDVIYDVRVLKDRLSAHGPTVAVPGLGLKRVGRSIWKNCRDDCRNHATPLVGIVTQPRTRGERKDPLMPRYAALLYGVEPTLPPSEEEYEAEIAEYMQFGEVAGAAGVIGGGEALQPTSTATTLHVEGGVKGGDVITIDGPFAETKEALGGFYLLDCADLDEALRWAAQIPAAWRGRVEVRPVIDFSDLS